MRGGPAEEACDVGTKRNAKGQDHLLDRVTSCIDVDTIPDGGIPISCIMTSAIPTHDQPSGGDSDLGTLTAGRVENLYDLMDAAYDTCR